MASGASVAEVARRRDVHRNLITLWRRQARTGVLACGRDDAARFAAVSVAPDRQPSSALSGTSGAIEVEFASGARMRVTGAVDAATLAAVVAALSDGRPR